MLYQPIKKSSLYELTFFSLVMILDMLILVFIVYKVSNYAFELLILNILFLSLIVAYRLFIKDVPTFLVLIYFLPLVYLSAIFHYDFKYELISSLPLFVLILLSVAKIIYRGEKLIFLITYIQLPLLLFVVYFFLWGVVDVIGGKNVQAVLYQLFQIFLYLMIFPFVYLIKERQNYMLIFSFLLVIISLIAIEYIITNKVLYDYRFVTFQSQFFPLGAGVLFSFVLFEKDIPKKGIGLLVLLLIVSGAIITLTRALWVGIFLVLIFVFLFYLISRKRLTFGRLLIITSVMLMPLFIIGDVSKNFNNSEIKANTIEYRTTSVTNPLEDSSFLMRVEFASYAIERFLEKPFLGSGLADYLKYKIFLDSKLPNFYMDSSWLYILWKGGIIGLILFLWMYIRFFKSAYFVLTHSLDLRARYICLGLLAGFLSLSFLGFLAPSLIKYKTNALIAFLFAYVEFERMKIIEETDEIIK